MKRLIHTLLICLFPTLIFAQNDIRKDLDSISSTEQATAYIKSLRDGNNKIITFNEEKHQTELAREIFKMGKGSTKVFKSEIEDVHYKVIEKREIPYYRVNYIMLDGNEMRIKDINSLRPRLIKEINKGTAFNVLASRFSMDQNRFKGGDSGWITHGDMLPEFEERVMNDTYNVDDVFLVNVESNRWYYVVQKTHEKKNITEVKVLRVVEAKK